jgi:uncharacterized protein YjbI with pentapeptide repeats
MDFGIETSLIITTTILSAIISITILRRIYSKKEYGIEDGVYLLKNGFPEAWNELRIKNPSWGPDIRGEKFRNVNLDNVNLSKCNIEDCCFASVSLEGASFIGSNLSQVDFTESTKANNVLIKGANLFRVKFINSSFDNSLIESSNLKVVSFDNTSTENLLVVSSNFDLVQGIEEVEMKSSNLIHFDTDYKSFNALEFFEKASEYEIVNFLKIYFEFKGYNSFYNDDAESVGVDLLLTKEEIWGKEKIAVIVKKFNESAPLKSSLLSGLKVLIDNLSLDKVLLITNVDSTLLRRWSLYDVGSRVRFIGKGKLVEFYDELIRNK